MRLMGSKQASQLSLQPSKVKSASLLSVLRDSAHKGHQLTIFQSQLTLEKAVSQ